MSDCIFCKIIAGDIPGAKIYEDDKVLSFLDIAPFSDGHALVIPKDHVGRLDECPVAIMEAVAGKLPVIARAVMEAVGAEAFNIVCNNGRQAGQLVGHLHFHIIPRSTDDRVICYGKHREYAEGQAVQLAEKIAGLLK